MRLFVRLAFQHADLVEVGFEEAFVGERVQGLADGGVVIGGAQDDVDIHAFFAGLLFEGLAMMMKTMGPSELLSLSG